jgi:hypothetical protein
MLFNACAAIDQGGYGGKGCGYGDLTWERAYASNDKYICRGDNSWPCDDVGSFFFSFCDVGSYYCPYGVVFNGLYGKGQNTQPSFTRGQLSQTVLLVPVIL